MDRQGRCPRARRGKWGGHSTTSATQPGGTAGAEPDVPRVAGGFHGYGRGHPSTRAKEINELKQRIGQWWQHQTPAEREAKNKWLNGPELLRHYVREGELGLWPGATLQEKFDRAAKANPDLIAGLQMRALEDGVGVWEDRQRKKALEAFNATLPRREWTAPDKHLFYETVKPAMDAVVLSDIALLQLVGVRWDQMKSTDPYANELIGRVKAEYDFARKNGATDWEARQYAFYIHSAATRWHVELEEAEQGVSRHAEDYGRKLPPLERIIKLTGAVLDLITVTSNGAALATETRAALKPLGVEAKIQAAMTGKAASKVKNGALAKTAKAEGIPESPKPLPDKLPDNVVFFTPKEGDAVYEHLLKNVDGFKSGTPAIWVRKDGKIYLDRQRWDQMTTGQKATAFFEEEGHMLRDHARSAAAAAKNDARYLREGIYTAIEEYHARLHAGVTKQQALAYALQFLTKKGILKDVFELAATYGLPLAPFLFMLYRQTANRRAAEKK